MEPNDLLQGRFRVEEFLGSGGMGEVWTAREVETGRLVAVKILRSARANGGRSSRERTRHLRMLEGRFERECDLLQRFRCDRIPRLLARGNDGLDPYLVMEHVDGVPMDEFRRRHTLSPRSVAALMTQLLESIAYAHANGAVHRDVKPHNAIVAKDGKVHLIDFGIAFLTDPDATRYTEDGHTPGSPGYRAPELIRSSDTVTFAADVYGAGGVMFLLLTGRPPFLKRTDRTIDEQHLYDPPPRVSEFVDHVDPGIDEIVDRMLAKEPASRPTPEEVIRVLVPHLPRPGDAAPNPGLDPDPTLPFRIPDALERPAETGRAPRRGRGRRRPGADRPSRHEYDELVVQAADEIEAGEPGPATARLDATLEEVRRAWGLDYLPIARACLRCGDAARLEGIMARARARYRDAERQAAGDPTREGEEILLEARIGLAECLIADELLDEGVAGWSDTARALLALTPVPATLVRRLREIALELRERGHGAAIQALLDRLPSA
ncbi:serine/threonine-protein kinase [Actinomadura bangladeshensis]|nr:serine/threonine-protein kinase [Actinomadura bangladeshensis]